MTMNEIIWLLFGLFNWVVLLPYMEKKGIYTEIEPMTYVMSFIYGALATFIHLMVMMLVKLRVAGNNSDNQP